MKIWIDAQLSPAIAKWIRDKFQIEAIAVRDIGLRDATDSEIFAAARNEAAVVLTKDADFPELLRAKGAPPKVIWLTCGNTSNARLKSILRKRLPKAMDFLQSGDDLVEIGGEF
jgi:predicted nuclease of predicted toxin-antitoxin system